MWGGGGGVGEVQLIQINTKKFSCNGLKNIHTRNLIKEKNSSGSKIPLPP